MPVKCKCERCFDEQAAELVAVRAAVADLLNAIAVVQQSYDDEEGEYVASWAMELLGAAVGRSQDAVNAVAVGESEGKHDG